MPIIRTGHKKTYYKEWPAETQSCKDTLIMAHGLGATNNFYTALIPHLTGAGYRCIAYDLHGCGLSPYSGIEQSLVTLADDAINLMDALNIKTAIFVGHSMSGMTGPVVAARYPDRIAALLLCAPVYPTEATASVFADRIKKIGKTGGMELLADMIPCAAPGSKANGLQRAFIRDLILGNDSAGYISLCRVIVGAWDNMPRYQDVKCPVLVLAGEEDKNPSIEMCETIIEKVGSMRKTIKVLNGVGHWTCIEAPDESGLAMAQFLGEIQKSTPRI